MGYTDDTPLYLRIPSIPNKAVDSLKEELGYMRANKLKLNPDKIGVLLVGSNSILGNGVMPRLAGVVFTPSTWFTAWMCY